MLNMFKDVKVIIMSVIFLVVGLGIGWVVQGINKSQEINQLEQEKENLEKEMETIRQQWSDVLSELNETKRLLADTVATIELVRRYQNIDKAVQEDVDEIRSTLSPEGEPTEETDEVFRDMIDLFNTRNNFEYPTTDARQFEPIDIQPFIELREEAEKAFSRARDTLLQVRSEGVE